MPTDKVRAAILAIQAQQQQGRLPGNLTIFDFETTHLGLRLPYGRPRPVEIAALRIEPGKPFQTFQTLVNPVIPMDPGAIATHGIQQAELIGAPSVSEALGRFREFSKGSTLIAHNAPFDIGVLESESRRLGLSRPLTTVVDTLKAARGQLPELGRQQYGLGKLAQRLGLEIPTHRAMADVWTTTQLFHMASKEASGLTGIAGEKNTVFTIGKTAIQQPLKRKWSAWKTAALAGAGLFAVNYLFSGFDDDYNTIEGMRHGGLAGVQRRLYTDFGSGKDRVRWFAKAAGEAYEAFISGSVFQEAISKGEVVRRLGGGLFGEAHLMKTQLAGEEFWFVKKVGSAMGRQKEEFLLAHPPEVRELAANMAHEAEMMRPFQEGIVPTVYRASENELIMEYARGAVPLEDLPKSIAREAYDKVRAEITRAIDLGIYNADIHAGNILYNPATKTPYWIDFGMARRAEPNWSREFMEEEMLDFGLGPLKSRFTRFQIKTNQAKGLMQKGNSFDGMPHGGEAESSRQSHSDFGSRWRGLFGGISRRISKWMARGVKEGAGELLDPRRAARMAEGVGIEEFVKRLHKETGIEVMLIKDAEERALVHGMIMKGAPNIEAAQQAIQGLQGGAGFFTRKLLPATKEGAVILDPELLARNFGTQSENLVKTALYHEVLERQTVARFKDLKHTQGHYGAQVLIGEGAFVREVADEQLQQTMIAIRKSRGKQEHAAFMAGFEGFQEQGAGAAMRKIKTDFKSGYKGLVKSASRKVAKYHMTSSGPNQTQLSQDLNRAQKEIWYNANYGGRRHSHKSHQMVKHFTVHGGGVGSN